MLLLLDYAMGSSVTQASKQFFIAVIKLPSINRVLRSAAFWHLALDRSFFQAILECIYYSPDERANQDPVHIVLLKLCRLLTLPGHM